VASSIPSWRMDADFRCGLPSTYATTTNAANAANATACAGANQTDAAM